jgi:Ran GTPase-activating protein (RanGAP) involved in mRNA processing and transport
VVCRALTTLSLESNPIGFGDQGVVSPRFHLQYITDAIVHHPSLEHLNLCDCSLGPPCIALLAATLPTCLRLEHLNLSDNGLDLEEMRLFAPMLP